MDDTLQRKTHNAFASLCVSIKAIPTASRGARREAFFLCSIAEWRNGRAGAPRTPQTRNEDKPDPCEVKHKQGAKEAKKNERES